MNIEYDYISWSVDKNTNQLYVWYPESPSISKLPDNYTVSVDNCTLIHKMTGTPVIIYEDKGFHILESITDWEMYVVLCGEESTVTLKDDIRIKIGAIVSNGAGRQNTKICGNATVVYHDSIWSESSIEAEGISFIGNDDDSHGDQPYIYCNDFKGTNIKITNVNRIYVNGSINFTNVVVRDDNDESKYFYDITGSEPMPGTYIYAGMSLTMKKCDVVIHHRIEAAYMTFTDCDIVVHNLLDGKLVINSKNRIILRNTRLGVERFNSINSATTMDLIYINNGNLILEDKSEIIAFNDNYEINGYSCISLGRGKICVSDSKILTTGYAKAIIMQCYGDTIVNPTGKALKVNFRFTPLIGYKTSFRFKTEINGYTMWVYILDKEVTGIECIKAENELEDFDPISIKKYITGSIPRIFPSANKLQYNALMASAAPTGTKTIFHIEAE